MNGLVKRKGYWIAGTAIALVGVAAVRLIAPELSGVANKTVMIAGYMMALASIFLITAGVSP